MATMGSICTIPCSSSTARVGTSSRRSFRVGKHPRLQLLAVAILKRIVGRLRERWPGVAIEIRADAGFAVPRPLRLL